MLIPSKWMSSLCINTSHNSKIATSFIRFHYWTLRYFFLAKGKKYPLGKFHLIVLLQFNSPTIYQAPTIWKVLCQLSSITKINSYLFLHSRSLKILYKWKVKCSGGYFKDRYLTTGEVGVIETKLTFLQGTTKIMKKIHPTTVISKIWETNNCPFIVSPTKAFYFERVFRGIRQMSPMDTKKRWSWIRGARQLECAGQTIEDERATQSQNTRQLQRSPWIFSRALMKECMWGSCQ